MDSTYRIDKMTGSQRALPASSGQLNGPSLLLRRPLSLRDGAVHGHREV